MSNHSFKYIQHQDFWWEASNPHIWTKLTTSSSHHTQIFSFPTTEISPDPFGIGIISFFFLNHDIHILFNLQIQQTGFFMVN